MPALDDHLIGDQRTDFQRDGFSRSSKRRPMVRLSPPSLTSTGTPEASSGWKTRLFSKRS